MCHRCLDAGWAKRVPDRPARGRVPTTSRSRNSHWLHPLSISIWYDTILGHDRSIVPSVRGETALLVGGYKIYQT